MSIIKRFFCIVLMIMVSLGAVIVCTANNKKDLSNDSTLLLVVDKSKESYGSQLKNDLCTQFKKQLNVMVLKENDVRDRIKNDDLEKISQLEQPELLELATKSGVRFVIVAEILPTKSDFREILFYQAIKSEATLKVRLYDAVKKQYVLIEEVASTGTNTTMLPYTFVGKKKTVLEAVHKATIIAVQKVNDSLDMNSYQK